MKTKPAKSGCDGFDTHRQPAHVFAFVGQYSQPKEHTTYRCERCGSYWLCGIAGEVAAVHCAATPAWMLLHPDDDGKCHGAA